MYTADNIIQEAAVALSKLGKFIKLTDDDVAFGFYPDKRTHLNDEHSQADNEQCLERNL
jgi:hypothetical protein